MWLQPSGCLLVHILGVRCGTGHVVLLPLVIQRGRKRMGLFYRNTAYLEDAAVQHHHHQMSPIHLMCYLFVMRTSCISEHISLFAAERKEHS